MRSFGVKVLLLSIRYTRLHLAPKNEKQATAWQRLRQSYSLCLRLRSLRGVWKRRFLPPGTVWLRWEMLSKTGPSIFWSTRALWKRREPTKQLSFWKGLCTLTLCCSSSMQFYFIFWGKFFLYLWHAMDFLLKLEKLEFNANTLEKEEVYGMILNK
jgi:hypothetical protein